MKLDSLIKDFESLLRYIAPGFTAIMIAGFCKSALPDYWSESWFWVIVPFFGIAWYAMHRTLLNLLDYIIYHIMGASIQKTYIANMVVGAKEKRRYLYTRLANIHLSIIIGQQSVAICWFGDIHKCGVFVFGLVVLIIASFSYCYTLSEINTFDGNIEDKNR